MMGARTIWKFELPVEDAFEIEMPLGAKPLTVQTQYGAPCLWALVDPEQVRRRYLFRLFGTGHTVPVTERGMAYVGTFQLHEGRLVFHLFLAGIEGQD